MEDFHNTTQETGSDLKQYKEKAATQQNIVYDLFKNHQFRGTPFEIRTELIRRGRLNPRVPITSIRRALSNLKEAGKLDLEKDDKGEPLKKIEEYGRSNYIFKLKTNQLNLSL